MGTLIRMDAAANHWQHPAQVRAMWQYDLIVEALRDFATICKLSISQLYDANGGKHFTLTDGDTSMIVVVQPKASAAQANTETALQARIDLCIVGVRHGEIVETAVCNLDLIASNPTAAIELITKKYAAAERKNINLQINLVCDFVAHQTSSRPTSA